MSRYGKISIRKLNKNVLLQKILLKLNLGFGGNSEVSNTSNNKPSNEFGLDPGTFVGTLGIDGDVN